MMRWFSKWKQQRRWDSYYSRDYGYADAYQQSWWKAFLTKVVIAAALFGVFYTFHDGEHWFSQAADNGVRYILNKQIDPAEIMEKLNLSKYFPGNIDLSVFKNLPLKSSSKPSAALLAPVEGKLAGNFGWRGTGPTKEQKYFEGIEFEAPTGTVIKAAASGQVKAVTDSTQLGKTIILQHGGDMETIYGYCTDIQVKNGDAVTQGQIIAKVGMPATALDVNKVYFELRIQGQAVDPKPKLNIVGP